MWLQMTNCYTYCVQESKELKETQKGYVMFSHHYHYTNGFKTLTKECFICSLTKFGQPLH